MWLKHEAVADIVFFSAVDSLLGAWKIIDCFACYQFFPQEICPWPWAVSSPVHIFFEDIHNEYHDILYHTAVILRLGSLLMRFSYLHTQIYKSRSEGNGPLAVSEWVCKVAFLADV